MKQSTKETLLKIPIIGQMAALAALPRELKKLQEENAHLRQETDRLRQETSGTLDSLQQQITERNRATDERWQAATDTFDSLGQGIRDLRERMAAAKKAVPESGEELSALRSRLSIHPAVWGPADRLHIDPEASLDACLFNTNSGNITAGKYSFAGPGVSLIAGSHDMRLTDFPRRDLQMQEGCDIVIGQGVWLCAGCTVLGPCRIGDHAVIAAGAVVIPGTDVEAGTLYAGVPARKIRSIEELVAGEETPEEAYGRFGGYLYTEGWYTAETIRNRENDYTGHWMIRKEAEILCRAGSKALQYISPLESAEHRVLNLEMGAWSAELTAGPSGEIRIPPEAFRGKKTGKLRLRISELFEPGNGDPRELGLFVC